MEKEKQEIALNEVIIHCNRAKDAMDRYLMTNPNGDPEDKALDAIIRAIGWLCHYRHGKVNQPPVAPKPEETYQEQIIMKHDESNPDEAYLVMNERVRKSDGLRTTAILKTFKSKDQAEKYLKELKAEK